MTIIFKVSTAEKIPVAEIRLIQECTVFGKSKISFVLRNGKKRNLGDFNDPFEYAKARGVLSEIEIAGNQIFQ